MMYTRSEWLAALKDETKSLPKEEQQRAFAYYSEMFEDKFEQGMTERDIILSFGDPKVAAKAIIDEYRESAPQAPENKKAQTEENPYLPKRTQNDDTTAIAVLAGIALWPLAVCACLVGFILTLGTLIGGGVCIAEAVHIGMTSTTNVTSFIGLGVFAMGFGVALFYPVSYGSKKMFTALKKFLREIKEGK